MRESFLNSSSVEETIIRIGLVGFGTVGTGVWQMLKQHQSLISERTHHSFRLEISKIAVRDRSKTREVALPPELLAADWKEVVNSPEVDLVVELIGGTTTAFDLVECALNQGKPVITGNKALLAERGTALFALSAQTQTPLYFEAAVAGGIPIIKALKDSFVGNAFCSLTGIINGTCNYILERMDRAGLSYPEALKEAMELGYAEADPTLDINGWDAGHKAILLGAVAYGFLPPHHQTFVEGIEKVQRQDIELAKQLGYSIKLVSVIKREPGQEIEIRTQPSLIPQSHLLAKVDGVFNAISVEGDLVGQSFFYGRGAGGGPTATAVVADLVEAAAQFKGPFRGFLPSSKSLALRPIGETKTAYFVRLDVTDEPGVMANITAAFSAHEVSFSGTHSALNPLEPDAEMNHVSFVTHQVDYKTLQAATASVEELSCVTRPPTVYRIESFG